MKQEEQQMSEEFDKVLTEMKEQNFALARLIDEELENLGWRNCDTFKGEVPDEMDGINMLRDSISGLRDDSQNALDILLRYRTQVVKEK